MSLVEQVLKGRIAWLEATNEDLCRELHEYRSRRAVVEHCETDAQVCPYEPYLFRFSMSMKLVVFPKQLSSSCMNFNINHVL